VTAVRSISPARRAAFQILLRMEGGRAHADELLRSREVCALAAPDRNLTTTLVLGILRWQIWLDGQVRPLLKKPGAKLEPAVRTALRLGAFQLLFLDRIPKHAAVDESVELVKRAGHRFASGMVNAVLRALAPCERLNESAREQAAMEAHPAWMVERWIRHYGEETARAICLHGQTQPEAQVRVSSAEDEEELACDGIALAPGTLLACARRVAAGDVTATELFRKGRVRLQDEGSQLIAEFAVTLGQNQGKILDACAAPGGKTRILAERLPRARIVALETSAARLAAMRAKLAAFADRVEFRHADAAKPGEGEKFDLALVDAPCSGTGTLGRNPEIRHRLKLEDLGRHAARQCAILGAALRAVRPGGRVIYSTCSLEREENEKVVAALLAEASDASQVSLASRIALLEEKAILTRAGAEQLRKCVSPDGALRLMPGELHTDGFFVALIEKSS
jgi:16S rRNA (cytosine967-C5)-methyltransferase